MARYTGPQYQESPVNSAKQSSEKTNPSKKEITHPDNTGWLKKRGKKSEYAVQLMEKQKAKYTYGILEKQFRGLFVKASAARGVTGEVLIQLM